MQLPAEYVRLLVLAVCLLGSFTGAGLYLRGFWLYFRVVRWIHQPSHAVERRRYRSSALAAIFKEPSLAEIRKGIVMGVLGLPLFAIAGISFNAILRH